MGFIKAADLFQVKRPGGFPDKTAHQKQIAFDNDMMNGVNAHITLPDGSQETVELHPIFPGYCYVYVADNDGLYKINDDTAASFSLNNEDYDLYGKPFIAGNCYIDLENQGVNESSSLLPGESALLHGLNITLLNVEHYANEYEDLCRFNIVYNDVNQSFSIITDDLKNNST